MDYAEWSKFIVAILGMAVGYGMLRANVKNLTAELHEHKLSTHHRFLRVEKDVADANKTLEGVKVSIENIDKRTDRMDQKLDKILEK